MRSLFRKMHKGEKGFTLVELLIVFTLLALLAAIMIPSVTGLIDYGADQSMAAEKAVIQTAVDCMMAVDNLGAGDCPVAALTQDMEQFPDAAHAIYPKYVRFTDSKYWYSTTNNGTVEASLTGS